ncbi:MAG: threonine synthase [Candidatus Hodarchaeales archaeon]|jgi:threonine synthase
MFANDLICPKCHQHYPLDAWLEDKCGYRLRINYELGERTNKVNKEILKSIPLSHWKYRDFFPLKDSKYELTTGEGGTALLRSNRLAKKLGINNLFLKLELSNPSGSFKDRPISVGASVGYENHTPALSAASSGNAAAALASYGAKAGIKTIVFVPERASDSKVAQLITLGATVVRVKAGESPEGDPSVKLFREACHEWNWTPCPSFGPFNPFQFEGTKSLAFEIVEQLNWQVPDWILCNTGSGGLLGGVATGFKDWKDLDWIDRFPKMVAVQPAACSPVVSAYKDKVKPLEFTTWPGFPDTVAGGLADPHPWDGDTALEMLYKTKGHAVAVSDDDILAGQRLLASTEGIFGSPSGVACIAALKAMIEDGIIDKSDIVVLPITGHGLKDPQVLQNAVNEAITCTPELKILSDELKLKGININ